MVNLGIICEYTLSYFCKLMLGYLSINMLLVTKYSRICFVVAVTLFPVQQNTKV